MKNELWLLAGLLLHLPVLLMMREQPSRSGDLNVTVRGIRNANGAIDVSLFGQKKGFPDKMANALRHGRGQIVDGTCTITFQNIPFGPYAVSAFHDENNDGKLNTTWYGMPKEGVAISRNKKGAINRQPTFEEATVDFNTDGQRITLSIVYL